MNPEKKAQQIETAALKAAQKALRRHPSQPVTRDELLHLRVQVVPLWMRLLLIVPGSGSIGLGVAVAINSSVAGGVALLVTGLGLLLAGIFGRRKTVESCLDVLGEGVGNGIVEAVLNSLDGL